MEESTVGLAEEGAATGVLQVRKKIFHQIICQALFELAFPL